LLSAQVASGMAGEGEGGGEGSGGEGGGGEGGSGVGRGTQDLTPTHEGAPKSWRPCFRLLDLRLRRCLTTVLLLLGQLQCRPDEQSESTWQFAAARTASNRTSNWVARARCNLVLRTHNACGILRGSLCPESARGDAAEQSGTLRVATRIDVAVGVDPPKGGRLSVNLTRPKAGMYSQFTSKLAAFTPALGQSRTCAAASL
jgi:hypothetical protein